MFQLIKILNFSQKSNTLLVSSGGVLPSVMPDLTGHLSLPSGARYVGESVV